MYNLDDEATYPRNVHKRLSFSAEKADFCLINKNGQTYFSAHDKTLFGAKSLKVEGKHNQLYALAVMALLSPWGLDTCIFEAAFNEFLGLDHRCQLVCSHNNVKYFNDSKATNVGACIASIESLAVGDNKNLILIVGGDGKGADFSTLTPYFNQYVKQLICLGKDAEKLVALNIGALQVKSMAQAVALAAKSASSGDIVLLAPACSSLDMYPNFMARGEDFSLLALKQKASS